MDCASSDIYSFEAGPIRPPSEGQARSLLIRATRNCPWNRCQFCRTYKGTRFEYRAPAEVKRDIAVARLLADKLSEASLRLGCPGQINNDVLRAVVRSHPDVYGGDPGRGVVQARLHSLMNVAEWLGSGAGTAFLQDADSLVMRTGELVEVIRCLKETFPGINRVTSYARSKTTALKQLEELQALREVGLSRLHVGLESGCDEVLAFMDKGVTYDEHVMGGRKVVEAGISLSEYVMPGLGGRAWSDLHARRTAEALNHIGPEYIRVRSLIIRAGTLLWDRVAAGEFVLPGEDEVIEEIGLFIENLNCRAYIVSDQMSNLLMEIEGRLPEDKQALLAVIARYRAMQPSERLTFRLDRRLRSYLGVYGQLEPALSGQVEAAVDSLNREAPDAAARVEQAIAALKAKFV
ncbi:MAG: radical SAM protein [Chloroflexota bacterium]